MHIRSSHGGLCSFTPFNPIARPWWSGVCLFYVCNGAYFIASMYSTCGIIAYLPQLGARLHLTHTQLNVFAVAGNGAVTSRLLLLRIFSIKS